MNYVVQVSEDGNTWNDVSLHVGSDEGYDEAKKSKGLREKNGPGLWRVVCRVLASVDSAIIDPSNLDLAHTHAKKILGLEAVSDADLADLIAGELSTLRVQLKESQEHALAMTRDLEEAHRKISDLTPAPIEEPPPEVEEVTPVVEDAPVEVVAEEPPLAEEVEEVHDEENP